MILYSKIKEIDNDNFNYNNIENVWNKIAGIY